jgi:hypothetical protein
MAPVCSTMTPPSMCAVNSPNSSQRFAVQWRLGCLQADVQQHALDVIDSGADLLCGQGVLKRRSERPFSVGSVGSWSRPLVNYAFPVQSAAKRHPAL